MVIGLSYLNEYISFSQIFTFPSSLVESVLLKKIEAGTE